MIYISLSLSLSTVSGGSRFYHVILLLKVTSGRQSEKLNRGRVFVLLYFVLLMGKSSIIIGCQYHNALLSLKEKFS